MREQLVQYVNLLFAGCQGCEDIRQEILQNTLDRYDDLIAEGKVPEAAYRLAITGIGDLSEILGTVPKTSLPSNSVPRTMDAGKSKLLHAIGIALYILCPIPLVALSQFGLDILGFCLLLIFVAAATVLMIVTGRKDENGEERSPNPETLSPSQELRKSIAGLIRTVSLAVFLVISFLTGAWYVTWLVFPLAAAIRGLSFAILDLKEETTV